MSRNSSVSTVRASSGTQIHSAIRARTSSGSSLTSAARSWSRSGSPARRRRTSSNPASRHRPTTSACARPSASGSRAASTSTDARSPRSRTRRSRRPSVASSAAHGGLGALDPGQPVRGDLDAVRHPAGQAGGGRLVPGRQPPPARGLADLGLGQPGVAQRRDRAPLVGGADPRPEPGHRVVGVGAGGDVAMPRAGGQRGEHVDQLGLAEEAAVAAVGAVALPLHLVGLRGQQLARRAPRRTPGPGRARPAAGSGE